jgi:hypothetical protein
MLCEEWNDKFKNLMQNNWQETADFSHLPEDLKAHVSTCSHCSTTYQAAKLLINGRTLQKTAPFYLSKRIITAISAESITYRPTWYGYVLLPIAAAVLIAFSVFITLTFLAPHNNLVTVHLVLEAAKAASVSVVGDWNGWDPKADTLRDDDGDGVWEIVLHLTKNKEYRYQFFIDGTRWIPDPHSEFNVEDGFGGTNSVLDI